MRRRQVADEENGRAHSDGAFMEPSRGNQWQSAANRPRAKTQNQAKFVATDCHRLPESSW
jgi:hypothetical protein